PVWWSTAVPVPDGSSAAARPGVRQHSAPSRWLHFADAQCIQPTGDYKLTGDVENLTGLALIPSITFGPNIFTSPFGVVVKAPGFGSDARMRREISIALSFQSIREDSRVTFGTYVAPESSWGVSFALPRETSESASTSASAPR